MKKVSLSLLLRRNPSGRRLHAGLSVLATTILGFADVSQAADTGFNQAGAGPFDYNTAANWVDSDGVAGPSPGDINGIWHSSLIRTATQTVTFATDTTLLTPLVFNYTGDFSTNIQGHTVGGGFTLTLGGDITVDLPSGSKSVTIGLANGTASQVLNVDLNGARTLNIATSDSLIFGNGVSNGGIVKVGGGTLAFQRPTTYAGTTTVNAGTLSFSTSTGGAANSDITANASTTVNFGVASGGGLVTRAKSLTLNGAALTSSSSGATAAMTDSIVGALSIGSGASTLTLTSSSAASQNERVNAGSFSRATGGTVLFRGTNLGVNAIGTLNSTNVTFDSTTGLLNQVGSGTTVGIIVGAFGDTTTAGTGFGATGGLVTYDGNGVRLLAGSEYVTSIVGETGSNNVKLTNTSGSVTTQTLSSNTSVNSLSLITSTAAGSGITLGGSGTLKVNSGVIYANSISPNTTAAGPMIINTTVDLNAQEGIILATTAGSSGSVGGADLQIGGAITNDAGKGITVGGSGVVTFNGATTNTYTGVTTVASGVLALNKSVSNVAITGNLVLAGGRVQMQASNQIADTSDVTVNSGTWDLRPASNSGSSSVETIDDLVQNGGTITVGAGGTGSGSLTVDNATLAGGATTIARHQVMTVNGLLTFAPGSTSGALLTVDRSNSTSSIFDTFLNLNGGLAISNTASGAYTPISLTSGTSGTNFGGKLVLAGDLIFTGNETNSNTVTVGAPTGVGPQGVVALNGSRTFDIGDGAASADLSVQAPLVNGASTGGLTKSGAGTLSSTGTNSYTGPTTLNGGVLEISGSIGGTSELNLNGGSLLLSGSGGEQVKDSAAVNLAGGTLEFANAANQFETVGILTLSVNSVLDFGTSGGNDTLFFAGVSPAFVGLGGHPAGTLTIKNWVGSLTGGVDGANDRLVFNGVTSDFTSVFAQSEVSFTGFGTGYAAIPLAGAYEIVPVPEPSSAALIGGAVLFCLSGYRERRRLLRKSTR